MKKLLLLLMVGGLFIGCSEKEEEQNSPIEIIFIDIILYIL